MIKSSWSSFIIALLPSSNLLTRFCSCILLLMLSICICMRAHSFHAIMAGGFCYRIPYHLLQLDPSRASSSNLALLLKYAIPICILFRNDRAEKSAMNLTKRDVFNILSPTWKNEFLFFASNRVFKCCICYWCSVIFTGLRKSPRKLNYDVFDGVVCAV